MAELRVMHGLVSEAAHKITEAASEAMENLKKNGTVDPPQTLHQRSPSNASPRTVFKYEAVVINPQLVIPRNSKSKEHAIADLGQISIFNHVEEVISCFLAESGSLSPQATG
jgi:hypothetical protein